MNTGGRIKQRRIELGLTADDLALKIGKSRATIYRYENGDIENMPTPILEPLAKALETTPADLMGWEKVDEHFSGKEASPATYEKFISNIKESYSEDEKSLISSYRELNVPNKKKVLTYSKNLLSTQQMEDALLPNAAHEMNPTEEEKKYADDVMKDDEEWE